MQFPNIGMNYLLFSLLKHELFRNNQTGKEKQKLNMFVQYCAYAYVILKGM